MHSKAKDLYGSLVRVLKLGIQSKTVSAICSFELCVVEGMLIANLFRNENQQFQGVTESRYWRTQ